MVFVNMLHKMKTAVGILSKECVMLICHLMPIKKNKVVFSSYRGRQYSDSPMFISEELEKDGNLDIVWIYNSQLNRNSIRTVPDSTLRAAYELATAKVWVDNCRKKVWVKKRRGQFYIQTWHGNLGIKKIEADAGDKLKKSYIRSAKHDSKMTDVITSGCKWATNNFRTAFWYGGEIWECGSARTDIFYNDVTPIKEKVYSFYGFDSNDRVIIYAPTFRNSKRLDCYCIDYEMLIDSAKKKWGGNWKVIVRLHPNMTEEQGKLSFSMNVKNGLEYQEINELIVASELLITDYSSCMFDAMEAGKKVIFYATDLEEYIEERGTYFQYKDLPFPLSRSNEELCVAIAKYDDSKQKELAAEFMKEQGFFNDGQASHRVADRIRQVIRDRFDLTKEG